MTCAACLICLCLDHRVFCDSISFCSYHLNQRSCEDDICFPKDSSHSSLVLNILSKSLSTVSPSRSGFSSNHSQCQGDATASAAASAAAAVIVDRSKHLIKGDNEQATKRGLSEH